MPDIMLAPQKIPMVVTIFWAFFVFWNEKVTIKKKKSMYSPNTQNLMQNIKAD